jgi:hypothetical protein
MIDTYYDNANFDAAKNDMAIRYRWTEGNRAGAWNFKPGMGKASKEGVVYRVEYGVDTTDNQPESLAKFADSNHPLNPFRLIKDVIPGAKASEFFLPAVKITDFRHKFLLKHQNGLAIEVSLDDVHPEALRAGAKGIGHYYQLEMDIDHLALDSANAASGTYKGTLGSGATGLTGGTLENFMGRLSKQAFLDGRPTLHVIEEIEPRSLVRTLREADFVLASSAIVKLRDAAVGTAWIPGAQKYAISAYVAGLLGTKDVSPSTKAVLTHLKNKGIKPELAGCVPALAKLSGRR